MSKITIIEPNTSDKDQIRAYLVKGEKGDKGDNGEITYNDVVDNLTTTSTNLPLSANQGKQLKGMIDDNADNITEISNTKLNWYYVTTTTTEDEIQEIINQDGAKVIEFQEGTYTFTKRIFLKSNCTFILNNSIFNSTYLDGGSDNIVFFGYSLDSTYTGYNGEHNIKFIGGKINTGFAFMHNFNIEFNNIEFLGNITSHALQIAGCKNFIIKNCTFNGTKNSSSGNQHELIQLETCLRDSQPYLDNESSISYDSTGNYNIVIESCIFNVGDGTTTTNYVCIGNHSSDSDNIYAHKNITIKNNIFNTSTYSNVSGAGFDNIIISNNYFKHEESTSTHFHIRFRYYNKKAKIYNNIFEGGFVAIGNVNTQTQYDFEIYDNKINMDKYGGIGLELQGITNANINNNTFECERFGIYVSQPTDTETSNILINSNYFNMYSSNSGQYGINIIGGDNLNILNNNVLQGENVSRAFVYITNATNYKYSNNFISKVNSDEVYDVAGVDLDYENIYGSIANVYYGQSTYSAINNASPSFEFSKFNRINLLLSKTGDASKITYALLQPYTSIAKFNEERTFPIIMNIDNNIAYATFSINADGTFNFSSSSGNVALRRIDCFNDFTK